MRSTVRDYEQGDLGRVLELWKRAGHSAMDGRLTLDQAVDLIGSDRAVTVVAEIEGEVVAAAIGSSHASQGWIDRISVLPEIGGADAIVDAMLSELEQRLAAAGARRLGVLAGANGSTRSHLERWDYRLREGISYLEREVPASPSVSSGLEEVFGRLISPALWDELKGVEDAKEIIERRVILPLDKPELARRHSVVTPRAIVLFGPPGTGKTTFAKGIASRLGWPFVELEPRELSAEGPEQEAKMLAGLFDRLAELPQVVVFVDEVEDLATVRHEERAVNASVTNEFLRQIPRMRERPGQLLVCATNWIDRLDPAFLRPGRFDYVLPVGPPDGTAREAIWQGYVDEITDQEVDMGRLVAESEMFTPADIEFAARKAAQAAFEREHFERAGERAGTADFLAAIRATRPTLTAEMIERFDADRAGYARL